MGLINLLEQSLSLLTIHVSLVTVQIWMVDLGQIEESFTDLRSACSL